MDKLQKTAVTITTNLGPLWDARTDLQTLTGILGAVLYLAGKSDADTPEKDDIITALVQVQETCARCAEQLHDAIKAGEIIQEKEVRRG